MSRAEGELAAADCVWQPGAERWARADEIAVLWHVPAEPPSPPWRKLPWVRAVGVGLILSGAALLILLPSLLVVEPDPRPGKRDCAFTDYVQGRCRECDQTDGNGKFRRTQAG